MASGADKSRYSRLLIVDDDANQLRTLIRIFEAEGCDVVGCATAAEALEHLGGGDVGVAVVDLRLPDSTGSQLLGKLEPLSAQVQIIIHMAYSSYESARDAVNLGAFAYVEKGADPNELVHHVQRAFRARLARYAAQLEDAVAERTRKLQASEERLQRIIRGSNDGLWEWPDLANDEQWWSPRFFEMLGYEDGEFTPTLANFAEMLHPKDRAVMVAIEDLLESRDPFESEYRMRTKSGNYLWLHARGQVFRNESGQPVGMAGTVHDITPRKRAEEAYQTLVKKSLQGLVILQDQRMVFANQALADMLGYTIDELLEMSPEAVNERVHPDDRAKVWENHEKRLGGGNPPARYQHRLVRKDGAVRWVEIFVSKTQVRDRPAIQIAFLDVTEQKKMEARLRQRDTELAHLGRLSMMGEMAAGLAHELNQPLYAITNYATGINLRLQTAAADSEELTEVMEKISGQAKRASEIIRRLRNTVQKREPHRSSTDLNDLLQDLLKLAEHELRQNSVSVHLDLHEKLPLVSADAIQIQQVALNLMRNAVDAMLGVSTNQRQLTLTTSLVNGHAVEVGVGDSGAGLSDEIHPKIFDPFFTTKAEGLGMGLAISRTIVEAHEGRIWATPNSPHGTVFRFIIPTDEKGLNRAK